MSAVSTPTSGQKAMSSRLLTMKFMQRAAASSTSSSHIATEEPSPKRRKKNDEPVASPRVKFDEETNRRTLQEAEEIEEAKRQAALERQGIAAGDTRWSFSFTDDEDDAQSHVLRVVSTGYASLDSLPVKSENDESTIEDVKPVMVGRRSFGNFNMVVEKKEDEADSSSDSDSEDDSAESNKSDRDSDDPTAQLIKTSREAAVQQAKAQRKAKRMAEEAHSQELAKTRKKKEVKLNPNLTSLSGRAVPTIICYRCGGPHHKKDCSQPRQPGENSGKRPYDGGHSGGNSKKPRTSR